MPNTRIKIFTGLLLTLMLTGIFYHARPVNATISACTASVSPAIVNSNSVSNLVFTVSNSDIDNAIKWVKFYRPTNFFVILIGSAPGWSVSNTSFDVTFTGNTISPTLNDQFSVILGTSSQEQTSTDWIVEVSDGTDGSNPTTCTGDTGVTISTPPNICCIHVDILGQTFARVNWTTNELADSFIEYGTDTDYGFELSDQSLVITHLAELNNLTPDTTYHYRVTSADRVGGFTVSENKTFTTLPAPTPTFTPTPTHTPTPSPTPLPWEKQNMPEIPPFHGPYLPDHPCPRPLPNWFCAP